MVTLLALVSAQRGQSIHMLDTSAIIIIIIIIEAFIKRRIPGKTTCSKALQYSSNMVVIKIK